MRKRRVVDKNDYIGLEKLLPNGERYTVKSATRVSGKIILSVICSGCHKDEELFPENLKVSATSFNKEGSYSCGCGKGFSYSEYQVRVLLSRYCRDNDYLFLGFTDIYKGFRSKFKMEYQGVMQETTVDNALNKQVRHKKDTKLVDRTHHIPDFIQASGRDDLIFSPLEKLDSQGFKTYWEVTCPICSEDKYSVAGISTGTFIHQIGKLKSKSCNYCRCSPNRRKTKEEKEFDIEQKCEKDGMHFVGWVLDNSWSDGDYIQLKSPVTEEVKELEVGHYLRINYKGLARNSRGFYYDYADREDYLYVLLVKSTEGIYCKVGRSFSPKVRLSKIKDQCGAEVQLLALFTSPHEKVYYHEQTILEYVSEESLNYSTNWTGEAFSIDALQKVMDYLQDTALIPVPWSD